MSNQLAEPPTRSVLITGAGQGLGRAFAMRLADEGHRIAVADLQLEGARAVAEEIAAAGGQALAVQVDVGDEPSVRAMIQTTEGEFGGLDVLVNNASIFSSLVMRPFYEIPTEEWRKVIDVNLTGVFLCSRHAQGIMARKGWGRIINISSAAVSMGHADYMHYIASKAGVIGMTRAMARELGRFGITANAILPGATETEIPRETVTPAQRDSMIAMRSLPRAQTPDDLSGVVQFLVSDDSRFVTGQSLIVDGGMVFN
jgi:3-oxoacyl-[acyl-carrier protein] reductase